MELSSTLRKKSFLDHITVNALRRRKRIGNRAMGVGICGGGAGNFKDCGRLTRTVYVCVLYGMRPPVIREIQSKNAAASMLAAQRYFMRDFLSDHGVRSLRLDGVSGMRVVRFFRRNYVAGRVQHCREKLQRRGDGNVCVDGSRGRYRMFGRTRVGRYGCRAFFGNVKVGNSRGGCISDFVGSGDVIASLLQSSRSRKG